MVSIILVLAPLIKQGRDTTGTNEQIWDELRNCFPGEVHRSKALAEESKHWPCGVFDEIPRVQEHEVQRPWREFDVESGLTNWINPRSRHLLNDATTHLDLGNNFLLGCVNVPCEHHAYDIRFRTLDMGDSCPQNAFPTATCIASSSTKTS